MGKSVDEFKKAFGAIRKPSRPKIVPGKIKGELEKAVNSDNVNLFTDKIGEVAGLDRAYAVGLVAYKLGKHFEDGGGKDGYWHTRVPADLVDDAIKKLVPGDMQDPRTLRMMDQAIRDGDMGRIGLLVQRDPDNAAKYFQSIKDKDIRALLELSAKANNSKASAALGKRLYDRDPEGTIAYLLSCKEEAETARIDARSRSDTASRSGDQDESGRQNERYIEETKRSSQFNDALTGALGPDVIKSIAGHLLKQRTEKATAQLLPMLNGLKPADVKAIAVADPEQFVSTVLTKLDTGTRVKMLSDPGLRDWFADKAGDAWEELVPQVPMLRLFEAVGEVRAKDKPSGDPAQEQVRTVQVIFDQIMDGDEVSAAYVGTKTGNPSEIMGALGDAGGGDPPRTDCHNMLMVLNATIQSYPGMMPGLGEKLKWGHCSNILMTKKLSDIGVSGRGLIDKSFPGNVFDESGAPTGQILFTGESGVNSHSWLEAGGMAFDPVLGISGTVDAVTKGSTFQTFDWHGSELVGKGGDWYFVKDDPSIIKPELKRLATQASPMGFSTAYYLTKDPARLLVADALKTVQGADSEEQEAK